MNQAAINLPIDTRPCHSPVATAFARWLAARHDAAEARTAGSTDALAGAMRRQNTAAREVAGSRADSTAETVCKLIVLREEVVIIGSPLALATVDGLLVDLAAV